MAAEELDIIWEKSCGKMPEDWTVAEELLSVPKMSESRLASVELDRLGLDTDVEMLEADSRELGMEGTAETIGPNKSSILSNLFCSSAEWVLLLDWTVPMSKSIN